MPITPATNRRADVTDPSNTSSDIRWEIDGGVAVVTLTAPQRRNAFDLAMCDEMVRAFDSIEANESVGAVIVTGEGSAFCAGADLGHLETTGRDGLVAVYEGFLRVARCPLPTVAAVNGPAVGAGLNLALACDVRVAGESARFDPRFLNLGIHPGGGHTWMLRRLVGPQTASAMVLFGQVIEGPEAERLGLAWRSVADDELMATATDLAQRAAAVPRELAVRAKATLADVADIAGHPEAVERELTDQLWSVSQPAFTERLAARRSR